MEAAGASWGVSIRCERRLTPRGAQAGRSRAVPRCAASPQATAVGYFAIRNVTKSGQHPRPLPVTTMRPPGGGAPAEFPPTGVFSSCSGCRRPGRVKAILLDRQANPAPRRSFICRTGGGAAAPEGGVDLPGLYGMSEDDLLNLLWQSAGLRALDFAPALPHMSASHRYMQVCPSNLAAWVSLLADMEVQSPAALLAPCPAFLLVPLTDDSPPEDARKTDAEGGTICADGQALEDGEAMSTGGKVVTGHASMRSSQSRSNSNSSGTRSTGSSSGTVDDECTAVPTLHGGSGQGVRVSDDGAQHHRQHERRRQTKDQDHPQERLEQQWCGGAGYGEACYRFVGHLRDELLMDELEVFGLLARYPPVALVPPDRLDEVIVYLSVIIKSAGRGHRVGLTVPAPSSGGLVAGHRHASSPGLDPGVSSSASGILATASQQPPPQRHLSPGPPHLPGVPSHQLSEAAELDQALYRFLRRAPRVLLMARTELSYILQRLSYDCGLEHVQMCRLLCAAPELLVVVAGLLAAEELEQPQRRQPHESPLLSPSEAAPGTAATFSAAAGAATENQFIPASGTSPTEAPPRDCGDWGFGSAAATRESQVSELAKSGPCGALESGGSEPERGRGVHADLGLRIRLAVDVALRASGLEL